MVSFGVTFLGIPTYQWPHIAVFQRHPYVLISSPIRAGTSTALALSCTCGWFRRWSCEVCWRRCWLIYRWCNAVNASLTYWAESKSCTSSNTITLQALKTTAASQQKVNLSFTAKKIWDYCRRFPRGAVRLLTFTLFDSWVPMQFRTLCILCASG